MRKEEVFKMNPSIFVGSGRKIGLLATPVIIFGIISLIFRPEILGMGGPYKTLNMVSVIFLIPGIVNWVWSVILILTYVPKKKLITHGPYFIAKHPLYNGVALLVLPWLGFILNTWLGVALGLALFIGSKIYAKEEEQILENIFREEWTRYEKRVLIPWL